MGRTTIYQCVNCNCRYTDQNELHEHIHGFSDCSAQYKRRGISVPVFKNCRSDAYMCHLCNAKFMSSMHLHSHLNPGTYCRPKEQYSCPGCDWDFSGMAVFADHLRKNQVCRVRYIQKHGHAHHDSVIFDLRLAQVTRCGYCEVTFPTEREFKHHFKTYTSCRDKHWFDQKVERMKNFQCPYCDLGFSQYADYQHHLRLDSDCHIQMNLERREHIKKEKMKQRKKAKNDAEKSGIRFHATDEAEAVFHKLSNAFNDVELTPDEKINRKYMVERFAEWSKLLREHSGTSVELLYPRLNDDLQLVVHNPVGSDEWTLEIVDTGVRITGLPSYDAAHDLAEHIQANREDWVK